MIEGAEGPPREIFQISREHGSIKAFQWGEPASVRSVFYPSTRSVLRAQVKSEPEHRRILRIHLEMQKKIPYTAYIKEG